MASAVLLVGVVARAHGADPIADLIARASASRPVGPPTTDADRVALTWVLSAARRGDVAGARAAIGSISNPLARKTALWTLTDAASESLTFSEADGAWRDLADWPRPERRQIAAEQLLEASGKSPSEVVAWFEGQEPRSARGVMVLASAYRALGRTEPAANLIRHWWRDVSFEADDQHAMLARFADVLTPDDHTRRADILLYGPQGPAARAMIDMLAADRQPAARARIALRSNARDAESRVSALSQADQTSPGVAFERAGYLRRRGQEARALSLVAHFPGELTTPEQAARIWYERVRLVLIAIREGNWRGAYLAAANSGLTRGAAAADAEFFAGWIALTRLNDPQAAGRHFAAIEQIGSTPITRGRAFYWMGRTAEARKDTAAAQAFYAASAEYQTVFYGQLAAEKLGLRLTLVSDPVLTVADRQQFEAQELVRAARLLADSGHQDLFRVFVLHLDDVVPTVRDAAMLVDLIRGYGDQASAMRAVRASAQRGLILTDRGYPLVQPPQIMGGAERALVLGVTRQESGFDPLARSGANARGMMQLLPRTARIVARRIGVNYSLSRLNEPDYNMTLGSSFLGQLVNQFSGSYVMATAGYNAGPNRPTQWSAFCGDPRSRTTDPIDFIECIPFGETRNYVMRVLENTQVYRAKLNGGSAPITLSNDLKRGGYARRTEAASRPATIRRSD